MNDKNTIGELISNARKRKNLTQQELAKLLMVTDKAVSNWETGKNYPDIGILKSMSKYLDIDMLNLIVKEETKSPKRYLKLILVIISIIFISLFTTFTIYFINNYNKNNTYDITIRNNDYILSNGLIVISNNKITLSLGTITGVPEDNYDITLYYKKDNKLKEIVSKYNYDNLFIEDDINGSFFGKDILNNLDNLSITISYYDESDKKTSINLDLKVEKKYSNNKFFYSKKENEIKVDDGTNILLQNLGYKKIDTFIYSKEIKKDKSNITLTYNYKDKTYMMVTTEEDITKSGKYFIADNRLEYSTKYKEYVIEEFIYQKELTCYLGECKNSKLLVNEFFEHYNLIK